MSNTRALFTITEQMKKKNQRINNKKKEKKKCFFTTLRAQHNFEYEYCHCACCNLRSEARCQILWLPFIVVEFGWTQTTKKCRAEFGLVQTENGKRERKKKKKWYSGTDEAQGCNQ